MKECAALTADDALYRFRLRVFALAEELGNVRVACRVMGIHPSTYYRWRRQALRFGLEILRPGTAPTADAERHTGVRGAAGAGVRARTSRLRPESDRGRV